MQVFYTKSGSLWKARARAIALVALLGLLGCDKGPRNLSFAAPCTESTQCRSGICLFFSQGSEEGLCSRSCVRNADCPEGWSCTAITQKDVMVCQKGTGMPFM